MRYTVSIEGVYRSIVYLLKIDVSWIVMLCCCVIADIFKDHSTFILSVELSKNNGGSTCASRLRH